MDLGWNERCGVLEGCSWGWERLCGRCGVGGGSVGDVVREDGSEGRIVKIRN